MASGRLGIHRPIMDSIDSLSIDLEGGEDEKNWIRKWLGAFSARLFNALGPARERLAS